MRTGSGPLRPPRGGPRAPWALLLLALAGCPDEAEEQPPASVCADGERRDERLGCIPVACGAERWASLDPPPGGALWVAPEGREDAAGSPEDPLDSLTTALGRAVNEQPDVIHLADGTYPEAVVFGRAARGLQVVGRCPDLVTLDGSAQSGPTALILTEDVVLTGITVRGGSPGVAVLPQSAGGTARLTGSDLRLEDNDFAGLVVSGGTGTRVDLRSTVVRGTTGDEDETFGVLVEGWARFEGVDLEIDGSQGAGLAVRDEGTTAVIDGLVIRAPLGQGLRVSAGASADLQVVRLEGFRGVGAVVADPGTRLWLTDAELVADGGGAAFVGLSVQEAGAAVIADTEVTGPLRRAIEVLGPGSQVQLGAVQVRDTARTDGLDDLGLRVEDGATAFASDLLVERGLGPGVLVRGGAARLESPVLREREFAAVVVDTRGQLTVAGGQLLRTAVHPGLGGGVGILADARDGAVALDLFDLALSDHAAEGLALIGPGRYLVDGASIERCGAGGGARAGLTARGGVTRWQGEVGEPSSDGLLLRSSLLRGIPGDAVLLDAATGTFAGNEFEDVGGFAVRTQNCAGVQAPEFVGAEPATNGCAGEPVLLGPPPSYPPIE